MTGKEMDINIRDATNGDNMKIDLERIQRMVNSTDIEMQNLAMTIFYGKNKDFAAFSPCSSYGHREKVTIFKKHLEIYANRWRGYKHRENVILKRYRVKRIRNNSF